MPPRPRKRKQEPSHSPDLISALPGVVLASVLSLLPIKDSVRTSILSSLNLDDSSLLESPSRSPDDRHASYENYRARSREIVSRIFSSHNSPIHSCRLSLLQKSDLYPIVNGFIETLTQRGIEELDLRFYSELHKLPSSIAFCKSLSKLRMEYCCFLDPLFSSTCFQNQKDLQLGGVKLSEETIHYLLAACLCLESLQLDVHCSASLLQFSSPTLRKLWLKVYNGRVQGITIVDAPDLKQLMLGETMAIFFTNTSSCSMPLKLGNSSFGHHEPRRVSAHCEILRSILIDISSVLPSIKTLAIRVMFGDDDMRKAVPSFLKCFPCLKSLDLLLVGRLSAKI